MEIAEPRGRVSRQPCGAHARDEEVGAEATGDPLPRTFADVLRGDPQRGFFGRIFDYLVRLNGSPEQIAWGLALGLFVAMTPTVGLQMLIAVSIAGLLRVNKASAALGVWLTNPLTIPFFYWLTYYVGSRILGYSGRGGIPHDLALHDLLVVGPHVVLAWLVGGGILGALFAFGSYLPVLYMIRAARATARAAALRRARRRERRQGQPELASPPEA